MGNLISISVCHVQDVLRVLSKAAREEVECVVKLGGFVGWVCGGQV